MSIDTPPSQACPHPPALITAAMVRAALDEHVQYLVPTQDINTPYRVEVANALQGIADHLNQALANQAPPR